MNGPLLHGGDWAGYEAEYGGQPLDFSSNVSPLGLPEGLRRAVEASLAEASRYPDPLCRRLREAIGGAEGVDPGWVLCGCGAADLIYRAALAKKPRRAVVTAPAVSEYEAALTLAGCEVTHHYLKEGTGFLVEADFLRALTPGTDVVFLCQPNNPTGRTVPRTLRASVLERCREIGALLVVDECFCGFLEDPEAFTMKDFLETDGNLLLLKAFTKLYAMAGLRLGYCLCGDTALLSAMDRAGPPWSVSGPAQAAGVAALRETDYAEAVRALTARERPRLPRPARPGPEPAPPRGGGGAGGGSRFSGVGARALTARERPRLAAALERLGFRVVPGEANYLLFSSPVPLLEPLRRRGILLRGCANYRGLGPEWYRTAVRTEEENRRLREALEEIMKEAAQ